MIVLSVNVFVGGLRLVANLAGPSALVLGLETREVGGVLDTRLLG